MSKTIGEVYGPAMAITEQAEADRYFAALVAEQTTYYEAQGLGVGEARVRAESVTRANLGY